MYPCSSKPAPTVVNKRQLRHSAPTIRWWSTTLLNCRFRFGKYSYKKVLETYCQSLSRPTSLSGSAFLGFTIPFVRSYDAIDLSSFQAFSHSSQHYKNACVVAQCVCLNTSKCSNTEESCPPPPSSTSGVNQINRDNGKRQLHDPKTSSIGTANMANSFEVSEPLFLGQSSPAETINNNEFSLQDGGMARDIGDSGLGGRGWILRL